jgi:proteasome lid subunit RPN8/RPN11
VALIWTDEQRGAVARHGERGYPDEVCGFLLGTQGDGDKVVREVRPVENVWEETEQRRRRFLIEPRDFLRAERDARAAGWEILGFYHSHPDHPARPSETDREAAWPGYSYVIQSVRERQAAEVQSWVLKGDRSGYDEETISTNDEVRSTN